MFSRRFEDKQKEIERVQTAFRLKGFLEKEIVRLIVAFEEETGISIDRILFKREGTLPVKGSRYTDLCLVIREDDYKGENKGKDIS